MRGIHLWPWNVCTSWRDNSVRRTPIGHRHNPCHADGTARVGAANRDGVALLAARRKEATYPTKCGAPKGGAQPRKSGSPKGWSPEGGAQNGRAQKGGGPDGWRPEGWGAQNFALFFPLPPQFSFFLLSLEVFSWNFGGVLVGRDLKSACLNPGGLQAAGGFHTTTRGRLKHGVLKCARLEFWGCRVRAPAAPSGWEANHDHLKLPSVCRLQITHHDILGDSPSCFAAHSGCRAFQSELPPPQHTRACTRCSLHVANLCHLGSNAKGFTGEGRVPSIKTCHVQTPVSDVQRQSASGKS